MNTSVVGYVIEQATMPIEEHIAKIAGDKVRQSCCPANQCEGLCGVAIIRYKMIWHNEWAEYARGN